VRRSCGSSGDAAEWIRKGEQIRKKERTTKKEREKKNKEKGKSKGNSDILQPQCNK
jgi:hypothetical protein